MCEKPVYKPVIVVFYKNVYEKRGFKRFICPLMKNKNHFEKKFPVFLLVRAENVRKKFLKTFTKISGKNLKYILTSAFIKYIII